MSDYDRIAKAISFIAAQVNHQPTLDEIAAHVHLSPSHFQRVFGRWVGATPKRFLQILTVEHAKRLLNESKPVLEVSDTVGLSSGSRLYDHFVQLEAVTPGEYKLGGEGMQIDYAVHETIFGKAFIALTPRGICSFEFLNEEGIDLVFTRLSNKWPKAHLLENFETTLPVVESLFSQKKKIDRPLSLHVSGTNFQVSVWKALLRIPAGMVSSYGEVATAVGRPQSARAVGQAVGANPVAFLIPCHRVIQGNGGLGGYHWGVTRKHAIHAWEAAR